MGMLHRGPVRGRALRLLALLVLPIAVTSAALAPSTAAPTAQPVQPVAAAPGPGGYPNIVLVMTDDMTYDELAAMPIVRRTLASRGVSFTHAYAPTPSCCPARATILTGQYAHNTGVFTNGKGGGGWRRYRDDEIDSLPVWLFHAGYSTSWVGKYMNGYPGEAARATVPVGWSDWFAPVDGVYNYRRWTINRDGAVATQGPRYQVGAWRDQMLRQVDRLAPAQPPFFLAVSFLAPHVGTPRDPDDPRGGGDVKVLKTPFVFPPDRDGWAGAELPPKPSYNERDKSDKPAYVRHALVEEPAALREAWQQRRESLQSVDRAVGSLVQRLAQVGELADTLVVFTSDNGYLLGEHGLTRKSVPYEESVHVPLLIRGPGFRSGRQVGVQVSQADLAPTFLEAGRGTATEPVDGVSLYDVQAQPQRWRKRELLFQYGSPGGGDQFFRWAGLRDNRWSYTEYANGERELYDMRRDPYQLRNVVTGSQQQHRVQRLHDELRRLKSCAGRSCH